MILIISLERFWHVRGSFIIIVIDSYNVGYLVVVVLLYVFEVDHCSITFVEPRNGVPNHL